MKKLKNYKTKIKAPYKSEADGEKQLKEYQQQIADLQKILYAQKEWAVLIVLQGMDTSGKDGLITNVFERVNPSGCEVTNFHAPSWLELQRDFLHRLQIELPRRGKFGVFNRSYYEDVIVPCVQPKLIQQSQIPKKLRTNKNILDQRCEDIVNFEKYLAHQGYLIIKFFLHLSKKEQQERLLARIDDPSKNWKFDEADMEARDVWNEYQKAYDFCLPKTNHKSAPWNILPADDKLTTRLLAAEIIIERMKELKLEYPELDPSKKLILKKMRKKLTSD